MLGRISTVTINTPDLPAAAAAYQRYLGYRVVDDGALGRDVARAWGRPQLAGQRSLLMEPESGAETYLRFVQGPAYLDYEPHGCVGWNAAELIVRDVDALAQRLAGSPCRILEPPGDRSLGDNFRAMQVVGPAREVLNLTQVRERLAAFDTPDAASAVDRVHSSWAPWYVIPADNKWFTRLVVAAVIAETFWKLELSYPQVGEAKKKELAAARKALMAEKK